ncbi:MAG: hypothetical protein ACXWWA_11255, partial [Chitinophagaceae bacterium]
QPKECRANTYYLQLWLEICERMQWQALNNSKGIIVDIDQDQAIDNSLPLLHVPTHPTPIFRTGI